MPLATTNPATGQLVELFPELSAPELDSKLNLAVSAFQDYRLTPMKRRAELLLNLADLFEKEQEPLARLMALEMGKPLNQGQAEAKKCAAACRYYAQNGAAFLANEEIDGAANFIRYEPIGSVLALMPWNYPFWQVIRCAAPALMAGNVVLLKHADNVPQCALALERLFLRAGFPEGSFQNLAIVVEAVEAVIRDKRISGVSLTGSTKAGIAVATAAAQGLKRVVLELGGSDAFVVMPSADLGRAVSEGVKARVQNCGQSCIAAKRFMVHASIYASFVEKFINEMAQLKVGDPLDPSTQVGPLAHVRGLETLEAQVNCARNAGAKILVGGTRKPGAGYYFEPTVIANLSAKSDLFYQEVFGPIALVFRVEDLAEAIALANATPFGLGASLWTNDQQEQERAIAELQVGQVFVNQMVASRPELPFGGTKQSGYGRELGRAGIREFTNPKSVSIAAS